MTLYRRTLLAAPLLALPALQVRAQSGDWPTNSEQSGPLFRSC